MDPRPNNNSFEIITIDGPAGAGKSTIAKGLAKALNFSYLDTGAMYRALTLKALQERVDLENEEALVQLAQKTSIDLENSPAGARVFLDGNEVTADIRTLEVTNNTFYIARAPKIREIMVRWQRDIGTQKSIVVEGRDVGTVVFPNATHKFYLDANVEERSSRRYKELVAQGKQVDLNQLIQEVKTRDEKDFTRSVGPLKQADDAIRIDSTEMTIEEVVSEMLKHIQSVN